MATDPDVAKDWVDTDYRPAYNLHAAVSSVPWPAPPATSADGPTCAAFVDDTYRDWYADPNNSGGGGGTQPPPKPPKKKN